MSMERGRPHFVRTVLTALRTVLTIGRTVLTIGRTVLTIGRTVDQRYRVPGRCASDDN
jgi:hypothetical protein